MGELHDNKRIRYRYSMSRNKGAPSGISCGILFRREQAASDRALERSKVRDRSIPLRRHAFCDAGARVSEE
ncbi:hypothetical protein [Rudaea sp.]|uniref:hypothetical protein n=1 Tax=Rudaea sp. TaxID=2136325 RepID=UPI002ED2D229